MGMLLLNVEMFPYVSDNVRIAKKKKKVFFLNRLKNGCLNIQRMCS